MEGRLVKHGLMVTAVVLLALQVVGLAAIAKQTQSLPSSDPEHFLSNATKMIVSHLSSSLPPALECAVAQVVPPQPRPCLIYQIWWENLEVPQIGLAVSLQHRSPPSAS
jgi:hypothetical protein